MREIRVECLTSQFIVADLSLTLKKGEVVYLPLDVAKRSADLAHAKKVRAVSARTVERWKVAKSDAPPWLRRDLKRRAPLVPQKPEVDAEEIKAAARKEAEQAIESKMASLTARLGELTRILETVAATAARPAPGPAPADLQKVVQQAVSAAVSEGLSKARVPVASGPVLVDPDEVPVFIPSGIVTNAKAAITLKSEESQAPAGLDEAAAALKAVRPKRKTRKD